MRLLHRLKPRPRTVSAVVAAAAVLYVLLPYAMGIAGAKWAYSAPFNTLPVWRESYIIGWESSGLEGKPRTMSEHTRQLLEQREKGLDKD